MAIRKRGWREEGRIARGSRSAKLLGGERGKKERRSRNGVGNGVGESTKRCKGRIREGEGVAMLGFA